MTVRGVDLSNLASKNLVDISTSSYGTYDFENCKLGASTAITTGTHQGIGAQVVRAVNCDPGDTNYKYTKVSYEGTITDETTIVLTGGASDGTTAMSRKMVSSANVKFYNPLLSDRIIIWNDSPGSHTATIEVVSDGVTFKDDELWGEVESLNSSGFSQSTFTNDRKTDVLATAANQDTSSVTWTTTGLSSPTKQKLVVSFTTAEKGPIAVRVALAKATSTVYVDPLVTIA